MVKIPDIFFALWLMIGTMGVIVSVGQPKVISFVPAVLHLMLALISSIIWQLVTAVREDNHK